MRASNSAERSPSKTMWVCESTQPGRTARPPRSTFSSAAGTSDAGPIQEMVPDSATRAASLSVPRSLTVRSSEMPVKSVLI